MKTQVKFYLSIPGIALGTVLLLLVPMVAMQFTDQVKWSVADFIVAGALIFITGVSFVLALRLTSNIVYKVAIVSAIGSTFLLIWVNLAVGLIGGGPNPGNLMYIGVLAIIIIGTILSRFTPRGMELAMFTTAGSFVLIATIALIANMNEYPESSVAEILRVNAFFAALFAISGLLFRYVALKESTAQVKN